MNNNIKIEDIKSEPLTTNQKEFLVSSLFSMMSKKDNQFVSKEKYDELESRINKAIEKIQNILKYSDDEDIVQRIDINEDFIEIRDILKGDNK